jgi:antitoxin component YwqK of YwqJK toxin-antitoxin module
MKNFLFSLFVLVSVSAWSQSEPAKTMVPYVVMHTSGSTHISAFKLDGQFHGKYLEFDENGQVLNVGQYDRGVKVGTWSVRSANGKSIYAFNYQNDRIQSVREFACADAL